jgi:hypothetical protein
MMFTKAILDSVLPILMLALAEHLGRTTYHCLGKMRKKGLFRRMSSACCNAGLYCEFKRIRSALYSNEVDAVICNYPLSSSHPSRRLTTVSVETSTRDSRRHLSRAQQGIQRVIPLVLTETAALDQGVINETHVLSNPAESSLYAQREPRQEIPKHPFQATSPLSCGKLVTIPSPVSSPRPKQKSADDTALFPRTIVIEAYCSGKEGSYLGHWLRE